MISVSLSSLPLAEVSGENGESDMVSQTKNSVAYKEKHLRVLQPTPTPENLVSGRRRGLAVLGLIIDRIKFSKTAFSILEDKTG
jgi:hypothetical protein